jgi:PAS domain S-box-containing protein
MSGNRFGIETFLNVASSLILAYHRGKMSQPVRILVFSFSGNCQKVKRALARSGMEFILYETMNVREFWLARHSSQYDVALLELTDASQVIFQNEDVVSGSGSQPPVILLVETSQEAAALLALEEGWAADYALKTKSGYGKLPYVIRHVLARTRLTPRIEHLHFLRALKRNYDAIALLDRDAKLAFKDEEAFSGLGYLQEEFDALHPFDLVHPHDLEQVLPQFQELIANPGMEKAIRLRISHKDGSWHWYQASAQNLLDDPVVQGVLVRYRNLTRRKQDEVQQDALYRIAQAALTARSLDDLFLSVHLIIAEMMPAENFFIALYDPETNQVTYPYFVDEKDEPQEGPSPLAEKSLTGYVIRTGRSLLCDLSTFDRMEAEGVIELIGSQSLIWLGVPLFVEGRAVGAMVVQDYSDPGVYGLREQRVLEFVSSQVGAAVQRKQAETILRQSEERLRSLFENATVGIYRTKLDGGVLFANPAMMKMLGYKSFAELAKINVITTYQNPSDRARFLALLREKGEVRGVETAWKRADGTELFIRESARLVRDERTGEAYCEGIVEDVSELRRFEIAVQENVIALETLAGIDREILLEKDPQALMQLVCRRSAELLGAPKACIASVRNTGAGILALYGFQDEARVLDEFSSSRSLRLFSRHTSFVASDLLDSHFSMLMPETRKKENIRAVLAESFDVAGEFRAVLMVYDVRPRNWSEDDIRLLKFLSGQIALSYEKTKLLSAAEYRAKNFETLYSLSQEIASRQEIHTLLGLIVRSALRLLDAQSSFIYLYDERRNILELTLAYGVNMEPGFTIEMGKGLAGRVAQDRKPRRLKNYSAWRYRVRALDQVPFSAVMSVPMVYAGHLIGVLDVSEIGECQREFSGEEMRLLSLFASQAASAVYNARLFTQIQKRNEELDRLYRALGLLIAGVSSTRMDLCQKIAEIVSSEFELANCTLWLVDKRSSLLERCGTALSSAEMPNYALLTLNGPGLIPKAIREATFINCGDVRQESDYVEGWRQARSEMVVPLAVETGVIGAIDLQSAESNAFREEDERLMQLFAFRAASMLEHVQLVQQTQGRVQRLETLHAIEEAVASSVDLRITLDTLLEQVISRLAVDAAGVLLFDPHLQTLRYAAGRGSRHFDLDEKSQRLGEGIAGRAALEQEIVYTTNLTQLDPALPFPNWAVHEGFSSLYAIPLISKGQIKGVLELFYKRLVYPDAEWLEFLETLARQTAIAIDGIALFEQFQNTLLEQKVALDSGIEVWSQVLETRGFEPDGHCRRVSELTLLLSQQLALDEIGFGNIYRGALLHDIGKLLLPDSLIYKAGPLDEKEWALVRQHPGFGREFLKRIFPYDPPLGIPYYHHENWDGSGYPLGLKGEQIPVEARLFRIVDTWDLMLVDVPYRKRHSRDDAIAFIHVQAGKLFDPRIAMVFLDIMASDALAK